MLKTKKIIKIVLMFFVVLPFAFTFFVKTTNAVNLTSTRMIQSNNYLFILTKDDGKLLIFKNSGENAGELTQTIVLGNAPSDLLIKGNYLYIALSGTNAIKVLNKNSFEIVGTLQTPKMPSNLAIDGNLIWSTVSRSNGSNYQPFALLLDDSTGLQATSTIYEPEWTNGYLVGNEQILINPNTHEAYLACSGYSPDNIQKFNISNPNNPSFIMRNVHGVLGSNGQEMNFNSDYSKIYYSTGSGGYSQPGYSILVVNTNNLTLNSSMVIGAYPNANSTFGNLLYAGKNANYDPNDITVFDQNNVPTRTYSFPNYENLVPRGISAGQGLFAATNKYLYLLSQNDNTYRAIYDFVNNTAILPICTSWTYSNWNTCVNGQQTRTIISQLPIGCSGGNPVLTQTCQNTNTETFSISNVVGLFNSYSAGSNISISVRAMESNGTVASQQEGFAVGAMVLGSDMETMISYTNGTYTPSAEFWDLNIPVPSQVSNNYNLRVSLWCSAVNSNCSSIYGHEPQVDKYYTFSVTPAIEVPNLFIGDGTYTFTEGKKVKLNNGAIIEPIYTKTGTGNFEFQNIHFKVYNSNNVYLGTTEITRVGWEPLISNFGSYTFRASVNSIGILGIQNWSASISLSSLNQLPACTSWSYSGWSECKNGTQKRTIVFSFPSGCSGGNPILTQKCVGGDISTNIDWTKGQWIKASDSQTVYFLDINNIRHSYTNEKIWYSYFNNDFSFVKTVTPEQMASFQLGQNVPFKSGQLIKIPSVPKVYKIEDAGTIRWLKTEETAKRLYGNNWNKLIYDLDESSFGDYSEGAIIE